MKIKQNNISDSLDKNTVTKNSIPDSFQYIKKDYAPILSKARFTIQRTKLFIDKLTYKKVNDWDNKEILSGTRFNVEAGWRKFSIIDILKLLIISDLRELGFGLSKIANLLKNIYDYTLNETLNNNNHMQAVSQIRLDTLEIFFLECLNGYKIYLIICEKDKIIFSNEIDLHKKQFYLNETSSPVIIIPFFDYVQKIAERIDIKVKYDKDPKVYELFKILPDERKILDIISNKNYESVTIKKQNGKIQTIKATEIQRGNFTVKNIIEAINQKNYQNVSVLVKDGNKINITREETIKF